MPENLQEILERTGVYEYGIVNTEDVEFTEEVRKLCKENTCRQYGKTWACPPAVGTVDECRTRAQSFETMLVFSVKFALEDSYDFEGMLTAMKNFKATAQRLDDEIKPYIDNYLILSNEGCGTCKTCTYPEGNPCRFPNKLHGSIEGYGIFVSKLASQAGISYNNGKNTITYFGALLY